MEKELQFNGKKFISARRASQISGYSSDYIGQLVRAKKIPGTLVGRSWYVCIEDVLHHKSNSKPGNPPRKEKIKVSDSKILEDKNKNRDISATEAGVVVEDKGVDLLNKEEANTEGVIKYFKEESPLFPELRRSINTESVRYLVDKSIENKKAKRFAITRFDRFVSLSVVSAFVALLVVSFALGKISWNNSGSLSIGKSAKEEVEMIATPVIEKLDTKTEEVVLNTSTNGEIFTASVASHWDSLSDWFVNTAKKIARPWIDGDYFVAVGGQKFIQSPSWGENRISGGSSVMKTVYVDSSDRNYVDMKIAELKNYFLTNPLAPNVNRYYITRQNDVIIDRISSSGDSLGGGSLVSSFADLSDITFSSLAYGDLVMYNGSEWINVATSSLGIVGGSGLLFGKSFEIDSLGLLAPTTTITTLLNGGFISTASSTIVGNATTTGDFTAGNTLFVKQGGNVGIGIANPTEKLEVNGVLRVGTADDAGMINLGDTLSGAGNYTNGIFRGGLGTTAGGGYLNLGAWTGITFNTSNNWLGSQTTRMVIDGSSGSVGIGTTSPYAKLSVVGDAAITGDVRLAGLTATGTIQFTNLSQGIAYIGSNNLLNTAASSSIFGFTPISNSLTKGYTIVGDDSGVAQATSSIFISSTGNVGIGTTDPTNMLTVSGSITGNSHITTTNNSGAFRLRSGNSSISSPATGIFYFGSSSTNANGTIIAVSAGIGTTSPYAKLSVVGSSGTLIGADAITGFTGTLLDLKVASTSKFTVDYGGNVTAAGSVTLSNYTSGALATDASGSLYTFSTSTWTFASSTLLSDFNTFTNTNNFTGSIGLSTTSPFARLSINNTAGENAFVIGSSTATSFIVDKNGNVGVGTASPTDLFYVNGGTSRLLVKQNTGIVADFSAGSGDTFYVTFNGGSNKQLNVGQSNTTWDYYSVSGGVYQLLGGSSITRFDIWATRTGADLTFGTENSEKMRITSNGLVGIGTTTPFAQLQISSTTASATFKPQLALSDYSAGTNLKHWTLSSQGGNFYIASATDAYATTTGMSALTILKNGNVGVGTASPSNKLHVAGAIQAESGDFYSSNTKMVFSASGYPTSYYHSISTTHSNAADGNNKLTFNISNAASAGVDVLTLTGAGNAGVGTTSPYAKLSVVGDAVITNGLRTSNIIATGTLDVSGLSTFASGFVAQASSTVTGNMTVGGNLYLSLLNCNSSSQALQTDGSGIISCGSITGGGASVGGGWSSIGNIVKLSTTTDIVGIGTTTPYAKLSINSGAAGTTTLALAPVSGQTANIIDIYDANGNLTSVYTASGYFGLGTTSPYAKLSVVGDAAITGDVRLAGLTATGTIQFTNLSQGIAYIGSNNLLNTAASSSIFGFTPISNSLTKGYTIVGDDSGVAQATSSIFISSTGNVGIGTTDPTNMLTVSGSITGNSHITTTNNSGAFRLRSGNSSISSPATGIFYFGSSSTNANGTIIAVSAGIGTTSPYAKLSVVGSSGTLIGADAITGFTGTLLDLKVASTSKFTVDYGGNVTAAGSVTLSNYTSGALATDASGSLYTFSTSTWTFASSTLLGDFNTFTNTNNFTGKLGIGTSTPFAKLSVNSIAGEPAFVIGSSTATSFIVDKNGNVGIGTSTPNNKFQVVGLINFEPNWSNTALGQEALSSLTPNNNYGWDNTAVGAFSLQDNTTGNNNTALGAFSLQDNTTGNSNTALGAFSLASNTTGDYNTAVGFYSLGNNVTGSYNAVLGYNALLTDGAQNSSFNAVLGFEALSDGGYDVRASSTVAVGHHAGYGDVETLYTVQRANSVIVGTSALGGGSYSSNTYTTNNTIVGHQAAYAGLNLNNSSIFGYRAGYNLSSGSNNILLGYQAGDALTTGTKNIVIGYDIDAPAINSSNTLNIGNLIYGTSVDGSGTTLSTGNIGIGTSTPSYKLTVANTSSSQLSLSAGAGIAQWAFRNAGGNFYLSTTTVAGTATTSISALEISGTGFGTTTLRGLNIVGQATSTSNVGIALSGGCFSVGGNCLTSYSDSLVNSYIHASTTIPKTYTANTWTALQTFNYSSSTAYSTFQTASTTLAYIGTLNLPSFSQGGLAVTSTGQVYSFSTSTWTFASSTLLGDFNTFTNTNNFTGSIGLSTTTPFARLSINANAGENALVVGSSTATSFIVDKNGNVGIGTTGPNAKLSFGTLTGSAAIHLYDGPPVGSYGLGIQSFEFQQFIPTAGHFSFNAGGALQTSGTNELLRITGSGNVGIGTTTPTNKLTITDTASSQLSLSAGAGIAQWAFRNAGGNLYFATTTVAGTATTSVSALSIISSTGSVGIGTSTPSTGYKLDVVGDAIINDTSPSLRLSGSSVKSIEIGGAVSSFQFRIHDFDRSLNILSREWDATNLDNLILAPAATSDNSHIRISQGAGIQLAPAGTEVMRLTNAGNVGIGTTSPYRKLSVGGSGVFTGGDVLASTFTATSSISTPSLTLSSVAINSLLSTNASGAVVATSVPTFGYFNATSTAATSTIAGGLAIEGSGFVYDYSTNNVGIGTASPTRKLQVGSTIVPSADSDQNADILSSGGVMINGGGYLTFDDGYAVHGRMRWNGSASTDEIAMELDSYYGFNFMTRGGNSKMVIKGDTGKVGVGSTTPWGLLSVNANGLSSGAPQFVVGSSTATNFIVANGGNVGIGTAAPLARLNVSGNNKDILVGDPGCGSGFGGISFGAFGSCANYSLIGDGTHTYVNRATGGNLYFRENNSNQLTILTGGNVGIGTTNPAQKLDVVGDINLDSGAARYLRHGSNVLIGNNGSGTTYLSSGSTNLQILNNAFGTSLVTILNTGNVGIGTTSPYRTLSVGGSAVFTGGDVLASTFTATSSITTPSLTLSSVAINSLLSTNASGVITATSVPTFGRFNATSTAATSTIAGGLAIETSGFVYDYSTNNVGIGTAAPSSKLNIVGDIEIEPSSLSIGSKVGGITFRAYQGYESPNDAAIESYIPTGSAGVDFADLRFYTSNSNPRKSERMRITPAGLVGIGTTTPLDQLSVLGHMSVSTGNDTGYMRFTTTGSINYIQSGLSYSTGSAAPLRFTDAFASNTWMTIGSTGNVGIGTTSAYSKFAVVNSSNELIFNDGGYGMNSSANYLTVKAASGANGQAGINLRIDSSNLWQLLTDNNASGAQNAFFLQFGNNTGLRYLTVLNGGNVGIGTTTPEGLFQVYAPSNQVIFTPAGNTTETTDNIGIEIRASNYVAGDFATRLVKADESGGIPLYIQTNESGDKTTWVNTARFGAYTANSNRFETFGQTSLATASGNVGIGTTNPAYGKLQVSVDNSTNQSWDYSPAPTAYRLDLKQTVTSGVVRWNFSQVNNSTAYDNVLVLDRGNVGIGTTTPVHKLTVTDTSASQLSLSAGAGIAQWAVRNAGGNFYLSTTTVAGTATTSISAFEISGSGFGTTTLRGLNISGQATSTSNVGFNITTGCYAVNGTCVGGGGSGSGTVNSGVFGQLAFYGANGTTLSGTSTITVSTTTATGRVGIATTTGFNATLTLQGASGLDIMRIASSTGAPVLTISQWGGFVQKVSSSTALSIQMASGTPVFEVDTTSSNTNAGIDITAATGQTANLINMYSSAGSFLSGFTASGGLFMNISSTTAINVYNGAGTAAFVVNSASQSVGIGTSTLTYALNVSGSQASSYIARINNADTANTADGLLITLGVANASRTTSNYFIGFADGSQTVAGKIQGGTSAVAYTTTAADIAEFFRVSDASDKPAPGEIVALDKGKEQSVVRAEAGNLLDSEPLGIVSTNPGFIGNAPICLVGDDNCDNNYAKYNVLVALAGQVPLKVTDENGQVVPGDYLTLSETTPGAAMKLTGSGYIVGIALTQASTTVITNTGTTTSTTTQKFVIANVRSGWREAPGQTASSTDSFIPARFASIVNFFKSIGFEITQNFIRIANLVTTKLVADRVETKEFCLDGVCISKEQLQALIVQSGVVTVGSGPIDPGTASTTPPTDTTASTTPDGTNGSNTTDGTNTSNGSDMTNTTDTTNTSNTTDTTNGSDMTNGTNTTNGTNGTDTTDTTTTGGTDTTNTTDTTPSADSTASSGGEPTS